MKNDKHFELIHQTEEEIHGLVDYIQIKIVQNDWHAVSDAANDIRELESKIQTLKLVVEWKD